MILKSSSIRTAVSLTGKVISFPAGRNVSSVCGAVHHLRPGIHLQTRSRHGPVLREPNGRFMSGGHAALVDGKRRAGIVRHGRYRTESERDFTGPDEASVSSLPWRSRRTEDFFDAHRFNLLTEFISIDPITVSQEIFRRCFKAERNCHGRIRQPYIFVETPLGRVGWWWVGQSLQSLISIEL